MRCVYKNILQIVYFLVEIILVTTMLVYISSNIKTITSTWELVERYLLMYGVYQIIVFIILSNINDVKKDSYLAVLTNYKKALLYLETNNMIIYNSLIKNIDKYQLKDGTMNFKDTINEYKLMKKLISGNDIQTIKYRIILYEHLIEESTLNWKFSFLLRILK